ncbi:MAG: hypothetical protein HYX92_21535 [Chloroflexi bacterium]|nr:hypothetical protein [Chloroflexota bacterium]
MTQAEGEIEILDPHVEPKLRTYRLAPRPADLKGKVIGVLENTKPNAAQFLDQLQKALSERVELAEVIMRSHHPGRHEGDMTPTLHELAERCDAVVTGVGI